MIKILELFGGIRACSKALERLGIDYECVDYVEIDKYAVASANAIYGSNYEPQDICKWDKDIEVDLIMHGSPCQDFSVAGLGKGGDEGSCTRSSLMYETIRIVEKLRPKYVVWENVRNLLSEKHKHNFDNYLNTLVKLGYNNYYEVLNAKDYGIPQNRKRVFVISIRQDIDKGFEFPSPIKLKYGIGEFLDKNVDKNLFKICPSMKKAVIDKRVKLIKKSEICNCITTKKNRWNNEGFVLEENGEYRFFSNCERFKLMGFDEEDYLKASKVSPSLEIEKQAGNSIVVNVLECIFKELFKEKKERKKTINMKEKINSIIQEIEKLDLEEKVNVLNDLKLKIKKISPFSNEPVDCVQWVKQELVIANDYNPNTVAPPEMELLHTSIQEDGYTQPIVVFKNEECYEVVDGFHRNRVGKECQDIRERIKGYLPVVVINDDVADKGQRIASTIRHNRARGKHKVQAMSDIVLELKKRNWNNEKISKKLGMDADEVLRLSQISGLAEMFADKEFSEAWECDVEPVEYIDESKIL